MAARAVIVGAGERGFAYSRYAKEAPDRLQIVSVAEPVELLRKRMQDDFKIPEKMLFKTWEELVEQERLADIAIIATQDRLHKEPALRLAQKGYHILLEKPMAVNYADCLQIVSCIKESQVLFGICHVLRYYPQYKLIRKLIQDGVIGQVCHIRHTEPVGFWHFAHSFVRGNWRNEDESSCSLLAKCCHDLDLISYWMGENKCVRISSFGSIMHFTSENKPEGAADNCLECPLNEECAFSAQNIYLKRANNGLFGWPVSVVSKTGDIEDLYTALRTGPYGRCVYECDNDVMSNQVVNMQFEDGATASVNMVAFTERTCERETVISGSKGEIKFNFSGPVSVYDFRTQKTVECHAEEGSQYKWGHGGSDYHLIKTFVDAVLAGDQSIILAGPDETLYSHRLVFEAERSRLENRVIELVKD